ncbi:hypothetical protein RB653_007554 [Dictyostelium firmibasis]|uniref:Transmembrane protein n=1 Tax=Dictyostelium firmibasis TaxID=79012 RepID=A0AAN7YRG9_9MYCE
MKKLLFVFFIINHFAIVTFGFENNICQLITADGLIDLSPLTLPEGGFYSGTFFDYIPNSFSLLFNICGDSKICNTLGNNTQNTNAQSCTFYPKDDSSTPTGFISKSKIDQIYQVPPYDCIQDSNQFYKGVSLSYYGAKDFVTKIDLYCNPSATSLDICDCIRINNGADPTIHKCSMFSITSQGIIDLSPLTLNYGYYSGVFFEGKPNSFSLLFNICGNSKKCSSLGGNNKNIYVQSCAFYPDIGTAPPMGYISQSRLIKISGGVSLSYYGGSFGTAQLDIYCDPSAKTVNIFDCTKINSKVQLFKCSMNSMYACPTSTNSSSSSSSFS